MNWCSLATKQGPCRPKVEALSVLHVSNCPQPYNKTYTVREGMKYLNTI